VPDRQLISLEGSVGLTFGGSGFGPTSGSSADKAGDEVGQNYPISNELAKKRASRKNRNENS
jgi:hypothetical protein